MWYIYTIITLVVFCLCVKAYVKVRDPFWYNQPVHHVYDIFSRFKNNTIINLNPPETNQYVNIINVKTERIDGMAKDEIACACDFVATNFLREKDFIEYKPTESNIMGYLDSNNHPSYISVYKCPSMKYDEKTKKYSDVDELYSVMTARPLKVTLTGIMPFPTYYVDHLCVLPEMRGKGIAAKSIQTFYYNVSRDYAKIRTYLFKREGKLTGIVPLTVFNIIGFDIISIPRIAFPYDAYKLIQITGENISILVDFVNYKKSYFKCTILPDLSNLLNNIKLNNIAVYGIFLQGDVIAVYIFRDSATFYGNKKATELLCSAEECDTNIFVAGFTQALRIHCNETGCDKIIMDATGGNIIISNYCAKVNITPFVITIGAYYFYNYITQTIPPSKCFILA